VSREQPPTAPVLVADLDDAGARSYLQRVAAAGGTACVPLITLPLDGSEHLLEVYTPGAREPLVLLARAAGVPTPAGFPLALRPLRPRTSVPPPSLVPPKPLKSELAPPSRPSTRRPSRRPGDLVGQTVAGGKLIVEAFAGRGGISSVYRARHRELGMRVAVKVLNESFEHDLEFCERFHAEALAASRLDHPNLARVLDFGQEPDGQLYIVMEFLEGRDLRTILNAEKRLVPARAVSLLRQVCAGLSHVHSRGILHHDIKPENIFVLETVDDEGEPTEHVKLCDFGIARESAAGGPSAGTPDYMSPERCIVLYEAVAGSVPFTGDSATVLTSHRVMLPEPPARRARGLPPRLELEILKALAKDPAQRHASARELRRALKTVFDEPTATPATPTPPPPDVAPSLLAPAVPASPVVPDLPMPARSAPRAAPAKSAAWFDPGSVPSYPPVAPVDPGPMAAELARDPTPFLRELAGTTDAARFDQLAAPLEDVMRELARAGDATTLWRIASTLDDIARASGEARAERARRTLRALLDPALLRPLAERALGGDDFPRRLVVRAGLAGAYAVYAARAADPLGGGGPAFVGILREMGPAALPAIRAALEHLDKKIGAPGAGPLVDDLLSALPRSVDEVTGELAARISRARAAAGAPAKRG
jgi:Holliday junction resolvase